MGVNKKALFVNVAEKLISKGLEKQIDLFLMAVHYGFLEEACRLFHKDFDMAVCGEDVSVGLQAQVLG
jgi:hypothetical protein